MRTAVAVRGALRLEVVALDRAGEALADRRALHVDELADGEHADRDLRAGLVFGGDGGGDAELAHHFAGDDARLGQVAGFRAC